MARNQINFNWGDIDLSDTFEIVPKVIKNKYDVDEMAFVSVSLYRDKASPRSAIREGRRKFVEICGVKPKIRRIGVIEKKEIKLFTSEQIEYTIEIIADKDSVARYYDNIIR